MYYKFITEEQSIKHTTIISLRTLCISPVEFNECPTVSKESKEYAV